MKKLLALLPVLCLLFLPSGGVRAAAPDFSGMTEEEQQEYLIELMEEIREEAGADDGLAEGEMEILIEPRRPETGGLAPQTGTRRSGGRPAERLKFLFQIGSGAYASAGVQIPFGRFFRCQILGGYSHVRADVYSGTYQKTPENVEGAMVLGRIEFAYPFDLKLPFSVGPVKITKPIPLTLSAGPAFGVIMPFQFTKARPGGGFGVTAGVELNLFSKLAVYASADQYFIAVSGPETYNLRLGGGIKLGF